MTRDGLQLPKGVITGIALEGELRKLVQVTNVRSFDDLPIPFRAIATDIGTGEMVVLKKASGAGDPRLDVGARRSGSRRSR